jgi:predicted peptidase
VIAPRMGSVRYGRVFERVLMTSLSAVLLLDVGHAHAQTRPPPAVVETTLVLTDGTTLRYGISAPAAADGNEPRPLVLVLHPGGRGEYYGSSFMQSIVEPALRSWGAVMVAPDVPDRSWATARSERAVVALLEDVMARHRIDPARILVTGFSMGGGGTWYLAARQPELFTGAIVMAGSARSADLAAVRMPIYLIHSPDDEVVPFAGAEEAYRTLSARGHPVELRVLPGYGHYMMGAYVPALRLAGSWMLQRWSEDSR